MSNFDPKSLPDLAERNEAARLHELWYAAWEKELAASDDADVPVADADALRHIAHKAMVECTVYGERIGRALMTDHEERLVRCAASGVPLWDNDEVLVEIFLRAALGVPPRAEKELLPNQEQAA